MTTPDKTSIERRVRNLFALAKGDPTSHEAETATTMAFELIAKHDLDAAALQASRRTDPDPVQAIRITIGGTYQPQQAMLLQELAEAHHCATLWIRGEGYSKVYGTSAHLDTVRIVFSALVAQMFAGASTARPSGYGVSLTVARRSWMAGYCAEISTRLATIAEQSRANSAPGAALVLVTDGERARQGLEADMVQQGFTRFKKRKSKVRFDHGAEDDGRYAGSRVNLGQTSVTGSSRALTR